MPPTYNAPPPAQEVLSMAPNPAPIAPPTAAQVGQSVFCKPAQPVNTLVSRTRGNAVRTMLIGFLLEGSAWRRFRGVKTRLRIYASLSNRGFSPRVYDVCAHSGTNRS